MTTRRALVRGLGAAALVAGILPAAGQRSPKIPRIGMLFFGTPSDFLRATYVVAFRQRLTELGYVDGKTILIEERFAKGSEARLNELARELVASKVDVIVTQAVAATLAARRATSTIPIVMMHAGNPVEAGLIKSFARPGGNVTECRSSCLRRVYLEYRGCRKAGRPIARGRTAPRKAHLAGQSDQSERAT